MFERAAVNTALCTIDSVRLRMRGGYPLPKPPTPACVQIPAIRSPAARRQRKPDHWTVKHRGFLHAMVHDPTTVATCKPKARWAISSRWPRSDGTPNRARTAAHASTLARVQIVTCGQALPLGSASGLWLGTVNSPEKQNARRCERRAFSSAATLSQRADATLPPPRAPVKKKIAVRFFV